MHSLSPFWVTLCQSRGCALDPDRVQAVVDWPTPDSRKAMQRFLGFANFLPAFIRSFSQLAAPLTGLNLHQDSVSGGPAQRRLRLPNWKAALFQLPYSLPLIPPGSLWWRLTRRRWGLVPSYPSVLPRTTRCTRARIFLTVCLPLNATMILVIETAGSQACLGGMASLVRRFGGSFYRLDWS